MINLYAQNCTDFNNNGLATLTPMECTLTASINDVWKLEAKIPYDEDGKFNDVTYDCFLKVSGMNAIAEQSSAQIFRIYDVKKETDGVYIMAYPVGLDARFDTFVDSLQLYYMTASQAISAINALSNKYTVTTDLVTTASAEYANANIISILNGDNGFVNNWGGEICYDNYNIKVLGGLGSNSGMQFRYGKNLQSMDYEVDSSNVITRLYPKSANGDILNAVNDYKIANQRYVDSSHFNNYPIPHIYYVATPYRLTQLNNDGSQEYNLSSTLYENIATTVSSAVLTLTDTAMKGGKNLDLAYIKSRFLLTAESDMTEGFAERIWRLVATAVNFQSSEFSNLIKQAIAEGFKRAGNNIITTMGWIGDSDFMAYTTAENGDYKRVNTWAKNGQKWWSISSDGITGPGTIFPYDTAEWKWYKPKKKDYKRFGNKSKDKNGYYMHDSFYKVNDTLYYFKTTGEAVPYPQFHTYSIDGFVIAAMYDSIVTSLTSMLATSEASFFNLLYTQMTNYCNDLYTKQEIDLPVVNIGVDLVDLSKTTEYAGYEGLLSVKLGDVVQCINPKMDLTTTERVVGIEYDVIRGFNNKVEVGTVKNSVVNLLNGIGSKKEDVKLVAGNNVTINNNVISVTPQPSVKDVRVNGQTVTYDGIANIDLDLDGNGLQWFSETENAFFGIDDRTYFWEDTAYDIDSDSLINLTCERGYWSILVTPHIGADATKYKAVFCPYYQNSYEYEISTLGNPTVAAEWGHGVLMLMSDDITSLNVHVTQYNHPPVGGNIITAEADIEFTEDYTEDIATRLVLCPHGTSTDISIVYWNYCSYEYDDTTIYVLCIYSNFERLLVSIGPPPVTKYVKAADLPLDPYESLEAAVDAIIPAYEDTVEKYSGIGRTSNLAFFAGGKDDLGKDAPIKIFADGTYKGLDKVEDVTVDGVSVVTNKIAEIQNPVMTGATAQANGAKGLVPAPMIAERTKFLRGDGTWAEAGGTSDLNAIEVTKAEYDALTPAQKADEDTIYFVKDYNGSAINDVRVNGTSVISGGVADVTTEDILNPSNAIEFFSFTSNPSVTPDVNLTEISTIETTGIYFDYKSHAWNQGASAWLREYETEIESSQGKITSSHKYSSYTDVVEGYELTHYTEGKTSISPYGIECHHETIGDENPDTGQTIRGVCQYSLLDATGLCVYEYDYENDEEVCALNVSKDDIFLNETTWDGTNDSLKDALAALSARITALGG